MFRLIIGILTLVTAWKVFEKYGEPGWVGLIPGYSAWKEYGYCWDTRMFWIMLGFSVVAGIFENGEGIIAKLIFSVAGLIAAGMDVKFSLKKAEAFGGGLPLGLLLFFLPFVGNLYLGFGSNRYQGNPDR